MTKHHYECTIAVPSGDRTFMQPNSIIANAGAYLAYGDQTDTFGDAGVIDHANVLGEADRSDEQLVYMRFSVDADANSEEFEEQLDMLAHIERFARIDPTDLMHP